MVETVSGASSIPSSVEHAAELGRRAHREADAEGAHGRPEPASRGRPSTATTKRPVSCRIARRLEAVRGTDSTADSVWQASVSKLSRPVCLCSI